MIRSRDCELCTDIVSMIKVDNIFMPPADDLFFYILIKLDGPGITAFHPPVDS